MTRSTRTPLDILLWPLMFPFERIRTERLEVVFKVAAVVTIALLAAAWYFAASMRTLAAPYGVLSFELAGDPFVARIIATTWDEGQRIYAGFVIGLRFLIGLCVSLTLAIGCLWQAGTVRRWIRSLASTGVVLAYVQVLAGILEVVTGVMLISQLLDETYDPLARQTLQVAVVKYALMGAGLLYVGLMPAIVQLRPKAEVLVRPLTTLK